MEIIQCFSLLFLLVSVRDLAVTASPSGTQEPNVDRSNHGQSEGNDSVAVLRAEQPMSEARLMEELKKELKEELLASIRESINNAEVHSFSRPYHYHHYHHHHRQRDLTTDVTASGTILVQELQSLKARLQAVESRQYTDSDEDGQLQATQGRARPRSCEDKLMDTHERLQAAERKLHQHQDRTADMDTANSSSGSTFVRWGRSTCPDNTQLVYAGVAGGSHYSHTGGASNRLCLTMEPQFDTTVVPDSHDLLYGAEYELIPQHHDQNPPCAVCRAPQSTTIMVPATLTCPAGWTAQYSGHLVAGKHDHKHTGEYLCLDGQPEDRPSGQANQNGALFYLVRTACGSLPCPPYIDNRVVTCVVCSQ